MSKGTIIYIGVFELPDKCASAHRVLNNAKAFRDCGYKTVFVGLDKELPYKKENLEEHKTEAQGFEVWNLPYPSTIRQWLDYLNNVDSVIEVCEKYTDVKMVIAYNYSAVCLRKMQVYCKKKNIKMVSDCTEWYSTKGKNPVFRVIKGTDSFLRMRVFQKHLDGLMVISEYLYRYYKNCRHVLIVPPLVDLNEEKWSLKLEDRDDTKQMLVYSGSGSSIKDKINLVVEALSELNDCNDYVFYVIGITKEAFIHDYPQLESNVEKLGGKMIFKGRVTHVESIKHVNSADYCIFFRPRSRKVQAGFPTKFSESISSGTPVVTSDCTDLAKYIRNNKNGIFLDIDDREAIKNGIQDILVKKSELHLEVEKDLFHYGNYVSRIGEWLDSIIQ